MKVLQAGGKWIIMDSFFWPQTDIEVRKIIHIYIYNMRLKYRDKYWNSISAWGLLYLTLLGGYLKRINW